ncbi:MAG: ion channel [Xanthomonadales bacterium]
MMLSNLLFGSTLIVINLGIQVIAVTILIRYIAGRFQDENSTTRDATVLIVVMGVLLLGHLFQFATWALLFVWLGEFTDFATAFYHSTVNFTSLGYGDIVMSESRRLLGALEAANGVLMFGLSAGAILSVMNALFRRREDVLAIRKKLGSDD